MGTICRWQSCRQQINLMSDTRRKLASVAILDWRVTGAYSTLPLFSFCFGPLNEVPVT